MREFIDGANRKWQLSIDCDTIEVIQSDCGVNILDMVDPSTDLLKQLNAFPPLLAKLLYAALKEQVTKAGVDERDFRRGMSGDALETAADALLEEIVNFFPQRRRKLLGAVLAGNREVEEAGTQLAMERLTDPMIKEQAMAALDRKLTREMAEALQRLEETDPSVHSPRLTEQLTASGSSTNAGPSPECSDSTAQDRTPIDDSKNSPTEPSDPPLT